MDELEKAKAQLRAVEEANQNEFIDGLLQQVEFLCEKANKRDYEPTDYERAIFNRIATIITNMTDWF